MDSKKKEAATLRSFFGIQGPGLVNEFQARAGGQDRTTGQDTGTNHRALGSAGDSYSRGRTRAPQAALVNEFQARAGGQDRTGQDRGERVSSQAAGGQETGQATGGQDTGTDERVSSQGRRTSFTSSQGRLVNEVQTYTPITPPPFKPGQADKFFVTSVTRL